METIKILTIWCLNWGHQLETNIGIPGSMVKQKMPLSGITRHDVTCTGTLLGICGSLPDCCNSTRVVDYLAAYSYGITGMTD